MRAISHNDLTTSNEIVIYLIADVHIGSEYANTKAFKDVISEVLEEDNRYVILNGDLIDNATKNSVSYDYTGLSPSASIGLCLEYLKPLADNGRILCINSGNHEDRSEEVNLNPTLFIANALGLQDVYSNAMSVLFVRIGEDYMTRTFSILAYHGSGGGIRIGSKANKVEDLGKIINCDVYCMSHVHSPLTFKEDYFDADTNKRTITQRTRQFVVSNSFLKYGGYGEKKGYVPSAISVPKIHLRINRIGDRRVKETWCEL